MGKLEFKFGEESFNKLFPFFILIDSSLIIKGVGKSLAKISSAIKVSDCFSNHFTILKPFIENPSRGSLIENLNQLVVIELKNDGVALRCKFQ